MKVFRAGVAAVILLNLALLAVYAPASTTLLRYSLAHQRQELRTLSHENRALLHKVALARRPDRVAARAAAFGIDLRAVGLDRVDPAAPRPGAAAAAGGGAPRPVANVPRR